jgi:hypothetical protein
LFMYLKNPKSYQKNVLEIKWGQLTTTKLTRGFYNFSLWKRWSTYWCALLSF